MARDEFRNALATLVNEYVETESDADDAIEALDDRIRALERWKEKHYPPS